MDALFNDLQHGQLSANNLHDPESSIFIQEDGETDVLALTCTGKDSAFEKRILSNTNEIRSQINTEQDSEIRLISISSDDSYSPLRITKPGMAHVLRSCNVSPDFLRVIHSMGMAPHEAENGNGHVLENRWEDGSFNISYLSHYYALKEWKDEGSVRRSWKLRQIGVHHSFSARQDSHTFIFLQPEPRSIFHNTLARLAGSKRQASLVQARPMIPHALLLSCYMDDWRKLIRQRGDQFLQDKENLLAQRLKDLRVEARFERLQFWYDLEDRLAPLQPILVSAQSQLDTLQSIDDFLTTVYNGGSGQDHNDCYAVLSVGWFTSRKKLVSNFIVSVQGLHKRTREILHLIEVTLELNNQRKLESINRNIFVLSKKNHIGAENIKVITILTLFFLPASLVSSFFGMNFFDFNEQSRNMITASNTWLYAAITLPLFFITMLIWRLVVHYTTSNAEPEDEEEKFLQDEE